MARACSRGHRLHFSRVRPGERGCDVCSREISAAYAFHCGECDYDLCGECHLPQPVEADLKAEREEVLNQLARLCTEQDSLEAAEDDEEEATRDALALHDARLLRLTLVAAVERFRDRSPQLEDLVLRHEEELGALAEEVQQLREENLSLALAASRSSGGSSSSEATSESQEVCQVLRRRSQMSTLRLQSQVSEFRLSRLRAEMQANAKQLHNRERQLAEMRKQFSEAKSLAEELADEAAKLCNDVDEQQYVLQDLHKKAFSMREECHLPAELKKKSSILLKALDSQGGRLSTEKRQRCLQSTSKLYTAIAAQAPGLLPLASRVKVATEAEIGRYESLEQAHANQVHRLHLLATRGVLGQLATSDRHSVYAS